MSLKKQAVIDQIEINEYGVVQVRTATRILENGKVISSAFHRHVVAPGDDYSAEGDKVKAICAAVHTADVISAYEAKLAEQ